MLSSHDEQVRGALTRWIAEHGCAPNSDELAKSIGCTASVVDQSLTRLAEAHALLLHPGTTRPWVVHPFALAPGGCWVETPKHGYWANCLYCAFGIVAALRCEALVTTRLGGEAVTAKYHVRPQGVDSDHLFHLSTPVAKWWDNVIYACSSFQPFRSADDIDAWCVRHRLPKGAVMTLPKLWSLATDWYGSYIDAPWRRRTPEEAQAIFAKHALTDRFWSVQSN